MDKLEQDEITMKLEEAENLKLQYLNKIQSATSQIIYSHDSDIELAEKFTQFLFIYEKNSNFKGKPSFKNLVHYFRRYGNSIAECKQKNRIIKTNYRNMEKQINFYQFMKKGQNQPKKNIHSKKSLGKPLADSYFNYRHQSLYRNSIRGSSADNQ